MNSLSCLFSGVSLAKTSASLPAQSDPMASAIVEKLSGRSEANASSKQACASRALAPSRAQERSSARASIEASSARAIQAEEKGSSGSIVAEQQSETASDQARDGRPARRSFQCVDSK